MAVYLYIFQIFLRPSKQFLTMKNVSQTRGPQTESRMIVNSLSRFRMEGAEKRASQDLANVMKIGWQNFNGDICWSVHLLFNLWKCLSSQAQARWKGGKRGEWFTGLANNRPMPDPPFPLLPTPILLSSPGFCDDKSSLTDQLTSFPPDLCLLTYIYPYKYEIFSSNYS